MGCFDYWGKYYPDIDQFHLAIYHCLDVGYAYQIIFDESKAWRRVVTKNFTVDEDMAYREGAYWGALHDVAKISCVFQQKIPHIVEKLRPSVLPYVKYFEHLTDEYYHGSQWAHVWEEDGFIMGITNEGMILRVGAHHGVDLNGDTYEQNRRFYRKSKLAKWKEVYEEDRQARIEAVHLIQQHFGVVDGLELPPIGYDGVMAISDWLASTDGLKPFQDAMSLDEYRKLRVPEMHDFIMNTSVCPRPVMVNGWKQIFPHFRQRSIQKLANRVEITDCPQIVIVEAATGSGKTEAALLILARILSATGGRAFFTTPTIAAANALYNRFHEGMQRILGDSTITAIAHSKVLSFEGYRALRNQEEAYRNAGDLESTLQYWAATDRKKAILSDACISTLDYVLKAVLGIVHSDFLISAILCGVLVIDEVHSYDIYTLTLLKALLRVLKEYGVSVVLLSATMDVNLKRELLEIYNPNVKIEDDDRRYPLITIAKENSCRRYVAEKKDERKKVNLGLCRSADLMPTEELWDEIIRRYLRGEKIGVMFNTVPYAIEFFTRLKQRLAFKGIMSHSMFTTFHRYKHDQWIICHCKKGVAFGEGCIVAATQTIEQSQDLDFDFLVTQLAPIDVLLQRLGRLWRDYWLSERREVMGDAADCVVIMPEDIDSLSSYGKIPFVYENVAALWRTAKLLEKRVASSDFNLLFPEAFRRTMNRVYSTHKGLKKLPDEIAKKHQKYLEACNKLELLAAANTEYRTSDVMRDKSWDRVKTRWGNYRANVHGIYFVGNKVYSIATNNEIRHPEVEEILTPNMSREAKRRFADKFYEELDGCCIPVYQHWVSGDSPDLAPCLLTSDSAVFGAQISSPNKRLIRESSVKYLQFVPKGNGVFTLHGTKHSYRYCEDYGFRRV